MKVLAFILMAFYMLVTVFWVANSPFLFSLQGIMIWFISILLGFVVYKNITEQKIIKKLLLYSCFFMVFLVIVTGLIHLAVTSMP